MNLDYSYYWWMEDLKGVFHPFPNREVCIQAAMRLADREGYQVKVFRKATGFDMPKELFGHANPRNPKAPQEPQKPREPYRPPPRPLTPYQRSLAFLNVPESVTRQQLKSAFRKLAKSKHPDTGGSKGAFLELQNHYEFILKQKGW